METNIRYIATTYAKPFVNNNGELYITWCGHDLLVIGVAEGCWIVPKQ